MPDDAARFPPSVPVGPIPPVRASHLLAALGYSTLLASAALAAGAGGAGGMPWEGPLDKLLTSLTGPVAKVIGTVAIIGLGFGIAFSEGGSTLRKALFVVLGLAIAFTAATWGLGFMGYAGGLLV